jgi:hypothetical protein
MITLLYAIADDIQRHKELFDQEMKYLHDNGFKVITMSDIGYNENTKYMYLK